MRVVMLELFVLDQLSVLFEPFDDAEVHEAKFFDLVVFERLVGVLALCLSNNIQTN
jgi:hypothetical protein